MKRKVVSIDEAASVDEACKMMGEKHIGSLVVTQRSKPVGIFTERDLLSKVVVKEFDIKKVKVKRFMSKPMVTIEPDINIKEAARIMTQMHTRRLVVVDKGKIVGIFTARDLANAVSKYPLGI